MKITKHKDYTIPKEVEALLKENPNAFKATYVFKNSNSQIEKVDDANSQKVVESWTTYPARKFECKNSHTDLCNTEEDWQQ